MIDAYTSAVAGHFVATLGNKEFSFSLQNKGTGQWELLSAEEGDTGKAEAKKPIDIAKVRDGTWSVIVEGKNYLVDLDASGRKLRGRVGDVDASFEVVTKTQKELAQKTVGRSQNEESGEEIEAPIAGRVVKLSVAPGANVSPGDVILVLEAMKMENEIRCEKSGVLASFAVAEGDSVEGGDLLASISGKNEDSEAVSKKNKEQKK